MTTPFKLGFDVLDLGEDENVCKALRSLIESGHEIKITGVMNNGHLQAIVVPGIPEGYQVTE